MKSNWIVFAAFIYFIFRLFNSAAKKKTKLGEKQTDETLRKALAKQAREHGQSESEEHVREAKQVLLDERARKMRSRTIVASTEDFESAYRSDEAPATDDTPPPSPRNRFVNKFGSSAAIAGGSYMETPEERSVYDKAEHAPLKLLASMDSAAYRQYIITKEVFDPPKALRR